MEEVLDAIDRACNPDRQEPFYKIVEPAAAKKVAGSAAGDKVIAPGTDDSDQHVTKPIQVTPVQSDILSTNDAFTLTASQKQKVSRALDSSSSAKVAKNPSKSDVKSDTNSSDVKIQRPSTQPPAKRFSKGKVFGCLHHG